MRWSAANGRGRKKHFVSVWIVRKCPYKSKNLFIYVFSSVYFRNIYIDERNSVCGTLVENWNVHIRRMQPNYGWIFCLNKHNDFRHSGWILSVSGCLVWNVSIQHIYSSIMFISERNQRYTFELKGYFVYVGWLTGLICDAAAAALPFGYATQEYHKYL